jgi:Ni,Fe-hydrogenase maturation factor
MSLPTALKLARELQVPMPSRLDVLTVEALDLETLTEQLTPQVAAAVPLAVELIRKWITEEVCYASTEERETAGEA